jgi:hypothetical protein
LYFCATEAHDGPFFVVVEVWQLPHLFLAMMSSAASAKALPANGQAGRGGEGERELGHVDSSEVLDSGPSQASLVPAIRRVHSTFGQYQVC